MNSEAPQGAGGAGMINVLSLNPPPDPVYSPRPSERLLQPQEGRPQVSPSAVSSGAGPPHSSVFSVCPELLDLLDHLSNGGWGLGEL